MNLRHDLNDPGRMPIIGGRLCLDLANTANPSAEGVENCRLTAYSAVLRWACHVGLINKTGQDRMASAARSHPAEAAEALALVLRLREALWTLFPAPASVSALPPVIGTLLTAAPDYKTCTGHGRTVIEPGPSLALWICQPVAFSALELLCVGPLEKVRKCSSASCGWLFVDESPTGRRKWCSMSICGNRAKARKFSHNDRHTQK